MVAKSRQIFDKVPDGILSMIAGLPIVRVMCEQPTPAFNCRLFIQNSTGT